MSSTIAAFANLHQSKGRYESPRKGGAELLGAASLLAARASSNPDGKMTMVAGLERGSGATSTLIDIAWLLRDEYNSRVLMVELDFRNPSFINRFDLNSDLTLAAAMERNSTLETSLTQLANGIAVLPAAGEPGAGGASLAAIRRIHSELMPRFDVALLDVPPLAEFSDALALAPAVSQMIIVVESGRSTGAALERASIRISGAGIRLLGAILNQKRPVIPSWLARRFRR